MNKIIASPFLRILAWSIDLMINIFLVLISIWFIVNANNLNTLLDNLLLVIIFFLTINALIWPLINLVLTSKFGGSVGKLATSIEIINQNNQHISFKKAIFRNTIGYMVSGSLLWMGFIWVFIDKERRAWHDMIADTYVVIKNKSALFLGILILILAIFENVYLINNIQKQIEIHQNLYQEIVTDIESSLNKPTTPIGTNQSVCINQNNQKLTIAEAFDIAQKSECATSGNLTKTYFCNEMTGTWWINLDIVKTGCSPACVVNVENKTAEINWRCTGLIPTFKK